MQGPGTGSLGGFSTLVNYHSGSTILVLTVTFVVVMDK